MKTTVEIKDALLIRAKQFAAAQRRPLRALIEKGLEDQLQAGRRLRDQTKAPRIKWVTCAGGVPAAMDLSDRTAMHEWLRRT